MAACRAVAVALTPAPPTRVCPAFGAVTQPDQRSGRGRIAPPATARTEHAGRFTRIWRWSLGCHDMGDPSRVAATAGSGPGDLMPRPRTAFAQCRFRAYRTKAPEPVHEAMKRVRRCTVPRRMSGRQTSTAGDHAGPAPVQVSRHRVLPSPIEPAASDSGASSYRSAVSSDFREPVGKGQSRHVSGDADIHLAIQDPRASAWIGRTERCEGQIVSVDRPVIGPRPIAEVAPGELDLVPLDGDVPGA
jgi:hypothetical protein